MATQKQKRRQKSRRHPGETGSINVEPGKKNTRGPAKSPVPVFVPRKGRAAKKSPYFDF